MILDILLCSFGPFDSAVHTLDDHCHCMFNIQHYYELDLCIMQYLNHELNFKLFEVKILTL